MDASKCSVVVGGHLCIDIIMGFSSGQSHDVEVFRPGGLTIVGTPTVSTGGVVSNTGLSLVRLGVPVALVGKVGDDPFGRLVVERVNEEGQGLSKWVRAVPGEVTSYTIVLNPPGTDRIFFHCPGANDTFADADVPDEALETALIFHLGYPPIMRGLYADGGASLAKLFERARRRGAITSLDMALPDPKGDSGAVDWEAYLAEVLPHVDLFMPSVEEFLFMLDRAQFAALNDAGGAEAIIGELTLAHIGKLADRALEMGCRGVLVKLGDRGVYLKTSAQFEGVANLMDPAIWRAREIYSPVFHVDRVAGTTGAGDTTIAGFLASIYHRLAPVEAVTMAVAVGACSVEQPDAVSGVRTWAQTRTRIESGWAKNSVSVDEPGWRVEGSLWTRQPTSDSVDQVHL